MLRITTSVTAAGVFTIGVAGRLRQDGCDAIDRIAVEAEKQGQRVAIDLVGLRLLDRSSVQYLANAYRRRIGLVNLPAYVRRWIEQVLEER